MIEWKSEPRILCEILYCLVSYAAVFLFLHCLSSEVLFAVDLLMAVFCLLSAQEINENYSCQFWYPNIEGFYLLKNHLILSRART
jgi:hypothetical protein